MVSVSGARETPAAGGVEACVWVPMSAGTADEGSDGRPEREKEIENPMIVTSERQGRFGNRPHPGAVDTIVNSRLYGLWELGGDLLQHFQARLAAGDFA